MWGPGLPNQTYPPVTDESRSEKKRERGKRCCLAEQQYLAFRRQECGMSGVGVRKRGKNAKYVHVYPGLALHSTPSDVLRGPGSIKGARVCSENSDRLLY